jgi:arginyl-tRNA synthetase
MHETLIHALQEAAAKVGIFDAKITLEHPADLAHGDWACNIAMMYAKQVGTNPRALGEAIAAQLREQHVGGVAQVAVAGPGFINITLTSRTVIETLAHVVEQGDRWGCSEKNSGHEVAVEYTDPNPFKAFHIGHLMSNSIGESLARLIESQGTKVYRANYQGDVGIHIACAIWGIQQLGIEPHDGARLGEAYSYGAVRYKNADKKDEWVGVKSEIDALNKIIYEKSDEKVNDIYRVGRQASLDLFEGQSRKIVC